MDKSQVVVFNTFSFMEAYRIFQYMSLRHLPVIDSKFQVVGMITRHNLLSYHFFDES